MNKDCLWFKLFTGSICSADSQLASTVEGAPLFEIFLTVDNKGEYKKQVSFCLTYFLLTH